MSTKYSKRINAALARDRLATLIDDVIGGDLVAEPKPDPEVLELAILKSNIPKEHQVYWQLEIRWDGSKRRWHKIYWSAYQNNEQRDTEHL